MPFRALRSGVTTYAQLREHERSAEPPRGAWLVRARRRERRKKRRDPLEQCPCNHGNVRGGVTLGRSGVSHAGAISRRAPAQSRKRKRAVWVPKQRKAPRSFGNRRPSRGGGGRGPRPCPPPRGGVSSPPEARMRRPGCSRERFEEGSSPVKRQVLRSAALGSRRLRKQLARLVFTAVPLRKQIAR
jgi:hypothetical protein